MCDEIFDVRKNTKDIFKIALYIFFQNYRKLTRRGLIVRKNDIRHV